MVGVDAGRPRSPLKGVGGALMHEDRAEIQLELEKLGKVQPTIAPHSHPTGPLTERFVAFGLDAETLQDPGMLLGTGDAGHGTEAVQIDLVCGTKTSTLGEAWAYQLTYPRHGFEALTAILEPNLTIRPSTLIVPTVELKDLRQANMVYGPVQNAVAKAIVDKLAEGVIDHERMKSDLILAQATVHPQALDRRLLHRHAYQATCAAIDHAFSGGS
jgi:formaldehyde-activating enzyme